MAGFREFVTGEVLTAANVDDFLAKQAVMKFADAAARDTALGTAVAGGNALREGMVAYLDDEDEVQYFDGTAWDAISQPPAGIGSNVVSTSRTGQVSTTSASYVDVAGFAATITPSSATSKVLVLLSVSVFKTDSPGSGDIQVTATSGADTEVIVQSVPSGITRLDINCHASFLHSPATTSAVTYQVQQRKNVGTNVTLGATFTDSLTLIEVAA